MKKFNEFISEVSHATREARAAKYEEDLQNELRLARTDKDLDFIVAKHGLMDDKVGGFETRRKALVKFAIKRSKW